MIWLHGIRISTLVAALAFALIGLLPGVRWRAGVAALAWVLGFEAAWQFTTALTHHGSLAAGVSGAINLLTVGGGWATAAWLAGVRPAPSAILVAAVVWAAWVTTGFQANNAPVVSEPLAEAFNETAKTAWALAYLLPLWQLRHRRRVSMRSLIRDPLTSTVP